MELVKEGKISEAELLTLYKDVGWQAYTKEPATLVKAVRNSSFLLQARENNQLIGLLRAITDNYTIVYIQDILVKSSHRRKGVGSSLLQEALQHFKDVRQIVLLTDESPTNRAFYSSNGFSPCDDGRLIAFAQIRS